MKQIRFKCPNVKCSTVLSLPADMQGRRVRCAACGRQLQVPLTLAADTPHKIRRRKAG